MDSIETEHMQRAQSLTAELDTADLEKRFHSLDAIGRIQLAYDLFGDKLLMTTSCGETSAVLLHLVRVALPNVEVPTVFVDTGYYPVDTYQHVRALQELDFHIRTYSADMSTKMQESLYGPRWEGGSEDRMAFRKQVKLDPLNKAFEELGARAWIRGVMREQTEERAKFPFLRPKNSMLQVHPILDWTRDDCLKYCAKHNLAINPGHLDITKDPETMECYISEICGRLS